MLETSSSQVVIESPASGDVTDDQHPGPVPTGGDVVKEAADSSHCLSPALATRIRDIEELVAVSNVAIRGPGVALSKVAFAEPPVEKHRDPGVGESDVGGFSRPT
jgi:hypothetical protein